jgi:hypothetical protein
MSLLKARVAAQLRRLERKIGIDREGRTVWVWLIPPAVGLVSGVLVPFMPGLPDEMGLGDRLFLAVFGMLTMTAIASIYLISFDNDHNQQAPVDEPPARGNDEPPEVPPAPLSPPPPQWTGALASAPRDSERVDPARRRRPRKAPATSGAPR